MRVLQMADEGIEVELKKDTIFIAGALVAVCVLHLKRRRGCDEPTGYRQQACIQWISPLLGARAWR